MTKYNAALNVGDAVDGSEDEIIDAHPADYAEFYHTRTGTGAFRAPLPRLIDRGRETCEDVVEELLTHFSVDDEVLLDGMGESAHALLEDIFVNLDERDELDRAIDHLEGGGDRDDLARNTRRYRRNEAFGGQVLVHRVREFHPGPSARQSIRDLKLGYYKDAQFVHNPTIRTISKMALPLQSAARANQPDSRRRRIVQLKHAA